MSYNDNQDNEFNMEDYVSHPEDLEADDTVSYESDDQVEESEIYDDEPYEDEVYEDEVYDDGYEEPVEEEPVREKGRRKKEKKPKKKSKVRTVIKIVLAVIASVIVIVAATGLGCLLGILKGAPDIENVDISPDAYYTTILDADGNETQTLVQAGSNRVFVAFEDIPEHVYQAFVAIEDQTFWDNMGIDVRGIVRASISGLMEGELSSGASTITQQVIKNNVLNGGMEDSFGDKLVRKIREQYLAVRLAKRYSKEEILESYLNTINLSHNCLGIGVAAERYFGKEVADLTISEASVIAAITSSPTRYDPINNPDRNAVRREYVLDYMEDLGYITADEHQAALDDNVYERIAAYDAQYQEELEEDPNVYSGFTDSLVTQVMRDLQSELHLTREEARNMLYSGGLTIYSTQDPAAQAIVDEQVNDPSNYGRPQYGISTYALTVQHSDGTTTNYMQGHIKLELGLDDLVFSTEEAAQAAIDSFKETVVGEGDEILGEVVDINLQPQVSFVLMDQSNSYVLAIANGRGPKTTSMSLQRATESTRQPGSVFKVLASFAPAIDATRANLSTVFYDDVYMVGTKHIRNWWGDSYTGYSNIRQGITFSMNVVAVRCLMEQVTPMLAMQYCESFGITTLVDDYTAADGSVHTDLTASLALGGLTLGVKNIEVTGAYAAIANGGTYREPLLYTQIVDRNGNVLIDRTQTREEHRVLKETSAWLLTSAMADSTVGNSYPGAEGISSTSTRTHVPGMSTAGKSGTTSDSNDQWFVGFTPYYTAGIWIGYDDNGTLSGATAVIQNIWRNVMAQMTEGMEDIGFPAPEGIVQATVCRKCGLLATGICGADPRGNMAYTEFFDAENVPTSHCNCHVECEVCALTGLLPSEMCDQTEVRAFMTNAPGNTMDSALQVPTEVCYVCTGERDFLGPNGEVLIPAGGNHAGETQEDPNNVSGNTGGDSSGGTDPTPATDPAPAPEATP